MLTSLSIALVSCKGVDLQPLVLPSRLLTEHRSILCSLKVKKQMSGSSGRMLMWTLAAQTAVHRHLTVMPPSTQGVGVGVQRAGPKPVHSGVLEEEAQTRGLEQTLITDRSELASAADCRRPGMLRKHPMRKRTWKSLRRYWCLSFSAFQQRM